MKTLTKTMSVLDLFTDASVQWSVTEIGRTLGLPVATTHRIVRSLHDHRYLERTERARYRLHEAALDLGSRATSTLDVRSALHPILRGLVESVGETVILSVPDERRSCARCIDRVEPNHPLRLSIDIGECTPLHAGATAKTLLAYLDAFTADDVLAQPLDKRGPGTITDSRALRAELELIHTRGWAYSYEETDVGAWGVAAPVLTLGGNVVAVIGAIAPTARHSEQRTDQLASATRAASEQAARVLDPRLNRAPRRGAMNDHELPTP